MTAFLFSQICHEAGLPPGVLNIVHGEGPRVGEALVTHPQVKAVSFTGSTAAGRRVGAVCADRMARVTLELGGKSAALILEDYDVV